MTRAVTAEFRKFFSTRMWWGMAIAALLSGAAFAALFAFIFTSSGPADGGVQLSDAELAKQVFTGGIGVGYLLTLAIGVMAIGSEYRHKTITSTFLAIPKRMTVMGAKAISLLAIGAFYGLLSLVGSVATGTVILSAKGYSPFADPSIWRTLALALLVLGLWSLIGLGIGILIPNQVAALLIAIGVAWIVEPILAAVLSIPSWGKDIAPYLPSQATSAMLDTGAAQAAGGGATATALSWWAGALVLAGYAVVMAGIGSWLTVRRDIS